MEAAMYNRYIGNTGRVIRIDDSTQSSKKHPDERSSPKAQSSAQPHREESAREHPRQPQRAPLPGAQRQRPPSPLSGLSGIASEIMRKLSPDSFEVEDILLILILWLLYKESGDEELLFTMIALFLL